MAWPRQTGAALLATLLAAGGVDAAAESPPRDDSGPTTAAPAEETPIADSIEAAVDKYVRERFAPCLMAGAAVPCFPVTLEVQGRQYSVRETLDHLQLDDRPVPGTPPTAAEMIEHGANPHPTSASVGFDPKAVVCKTKELLRKIQGRSRKYYLYRVWDETGERAVLRDRPLDPNALVQSPHFRYVPLGEFGDECEAVRAYLTTTHDVRLRREAERAKPEEETPLPGPPDGGTE